MLTNDSIEILKLLNVSDCSFGFLINNVRLSSDNATQLLSTLIRKKYIRKVNPSDVYYGRAEDVVYSITIEGKAKIESIISNETERKSENLHRWLNTVIATIALLLSIIELLK